MNKQELINRITDYLASGGLFNPELMEPEKVQRLLIDIRDHLLETNKPLSIPSNPWIPPYNPSTPYGPISNNCPKCGLKLDAVMGYVCSNPQCPTGLGGAWCSTENAAI